MSFPYDIREEFGKGRIKVQVFLIGNSMRVPLSIWESGMKRGALLHHRYPEEDLSKNWERGRRYGGGCDSTRRGKRSRALAFLEKSVIMKSCDEPNVAVATFTLGRSKRRSGP